YKTLLSQMNTSDFDPTYLRQVALVELAGKFFTQAMPQLAGIYKEALKNEYMEHVKKSGEFLFGDKKLQAFENRFDQVWFESAAEAQLKISAVPPEKSKHVLTRETN